MVGEWKKTTDCSTGKTTHTRTVTTTDYEWDAEGGAWEAVVTSATETEVRDATAEECAVAPAPAKAEPAKSSAQLAETGGETSLWLLPAAGLALLAGLGAMVRSRVARR